MSKNIITPLTKMANKISAVYSSLIKTERRDLLWENPSPEASFTTQDITLPVNTYTNYEYLEIEFITNQNDRLMLTTRNKMNFGGLMNSISYYASGGNHWFIEHRSYWWNTDHESLHFDSGYMNQVASGSYEALAEAVCVPIRILGVKPVIGSASASEYMPMEVEKRDLIWENSNPTNTFASTTLTTFLQPLENYDSVEILYYTSSQSQLVKSDQIEKNYKGLVFCRKNTNDAVMGIRSFEINTDNIVIGGGIYWTDNNSTLKSGDDICVPIKIYGLKKELIMKPSNITGFYNECREIIWYKETRASLGAGTLSSSSTQGGTWCASHEISYFDEIEMYYVWNTVYSNHAMYIKVPAGEKIRLSLVSGNSKGGERTFTPSGNGWTITDAIYDGSTNNIYALPIKIVGVKHVI